MRAVDIVRRVAPKAHPNYLAAFERGDGDLRERGVTAPLRLAHFLAQIAHETGGFTILRESGRYSASRIMQIFGVGRHSAAITAEEAKRLAGNGPALFDRVYGIGNPRKAKELGNTQAGDGWDYRGNGLNQGTGKGFHKRASKACGVDFVAHPELATSPEWALKFALAEWDDEFVELSDRNDIRGVTRRLNGGFNGLADRIAWFDKIWAVMNDGATAPSWKASEPDPEIEELQQDLVALGYPIQIDGRQGPKTEAAIKDFQRKAGIPVDGVAGPVTRAAIQSALANQTAPRPESASPPVVENPAGKSVGPLGGGIGGEIILQQAEKLEPIAPYSPYLRAAVAVLILIGVGLMLYGVYRQFRPKRGAPS